MKGRTITTSNGLLQLTPATVDEIYGIARFWPMGITLNDEEHDFCGLMFQRGDSETHGIRLKPADQDAKAADIQHTCNRTLIAIAMRYYLALGHKGLLLPCAYLNKKANGSVESGIAMFVQAEPVDTFTPSQGKKLDNYFGDGAERMVGHMVTCLRQASETSGIELYEMIGADIRPRLSIGGLAMHFLVEGSRLFVIKDPIVDDDPTWSALTMCGFEELPFAPMRAAGTLR